MSINHDFQKIIQTTASVLLDVSCIDQCIPGTAILLKVLHRTGYPAAYPLTVGVKIVNPSHPEVGIMLGKGTDPEPGKWPGHLVVIIPNYEGDDHLMIDLTIVQVNGKVPDITLDPFLSMVDEKFVKGGYPVEHVANNCSLIYEGFPADESYKQAANWSNVPKLDQSVQKVMEQLG